MARDLDLGYGEGFPFGSNLCLCWFGHDSYYCDCGDAPLRFHGYGERFRSQDNKTYGELFLEELSITLGSCLIWAFVRLDLLFFSESQSLAKTDFWVSSDYGEFFLEELSIALSLMLAAIFCVEWGITI